MLNIVDVVANCSNLQLLVDHLLNNCHERIEVIFLLNTIISSKRCRFP